MCVHISSYLCVCTFECFNLHSCHVCECVCVREPCVCLFVLCVCVCVCVFVCLFVCLFVYSVFVTLCGSCPVGSILIYFSACNNASFNLFVGSCLCVTYLTPVDL